MKKLLFLLFLITSCGQVPVVTMCVPSTKFDGVYCAKYSYEQLEFIEELIKYDLDRIEGGFCFPKEDWLKKMKPYLKKLKRKVKDDD